jgi:hypothetical protein
MSSHPYEAFHPVTVIKVRDHYPAGRRSMDEFIVLEVHPYMRDPSTGIEEKKVSFFKFGA